MSQRDGRPGLPILGWSTVGGDLRIPHFVGIHGLQGMILVGLALTVLGHRYAVLGPVGVRLRIVLITATAYAAILAILTWQALRGQSIIHPDLSTAGATAAVIAATLAAYAIALWSRAESNSR